MLEQSVYVDGWPAKMSDDSDNDMFITQSHYLDSFEHAISTDEILDDVLGLADKNKTNVDLRFDLFSGNTSDEITQIS